MSCSNEIATVVACGIVVCQGLLLVGVVFCFYKFATTGESK